VKTFNKNFHLIKLENLLMRPLNCFLVLTFSCFLILLSGCGSTDSNNGNNQNETLVPLQPGNTWTYEFDDSQFDFEVEGEETITVMDTRTINDEQYHEMEHVMKDDEGEEIETFFAGYKGIGLYLGQGSPFAEFPLKFPVEDGEIYTHTDEDGNQYTITATEKTVHVPAGNFSCIEYNIKVNQSGADTDTNVCISPEVGLVRSGGFELTSFDIN
jgi:hypothetical protein